MITNKELDPRDKRQKYVGLKFGAWTVIGVSDKKSKVVCQCECGNIKDIFYMTLKDGTSTNCGCKNIKIKVGEKYNELTVLKDLGSGFRHNQKCHLWWCKCSCGNELDRSTHELLYQKSCGCLFEANQYQNKENKYDLTGEYGIGYTSKGETFYFDIEDYEKIKCYCWSLSDHGYVWAKSKDNNTSNTLMHRIIMNNPENLFIDHINHNKADNRKNNLRIVTPLQNSYNTTITNIYGISGVYKNKNNKYYAYISINKKRIHLGTYENVEDAIKARKDAEDKYYGEYSYLNSINLEKEE